ncbi:anti-sigma factor antagonist [Deferribacter desulfuricans SSM1]|uniref:Anti-sigma factor antagonist n=1 Tax=Deferribacter desulfuricans (strain DSM 14783 / JCM 11476 / NBRC 101012 / SSM1) TaxID=639282 RepID=D3PCV0_DEFDS|nr:STAS domain-containing protein [Deferribacter desulfuricans]BAI80423.1 anti-sigma factor antagonist [Deferribacter desulfuricans SSM1]
MAFKTEKVEDVEIIIPLSEIDAINGNEIRDHISKLKNVSGVIINFDRVIYLNSSGLRELIQSLKYLKDNHIPFALCNLSENIHKIFSNTNLNKLFNIFKNEKDAIKFIKEEYTI